MFQSVFRVRLGPSGPSGSSGSSGSSHSVGGFMPADPRWSCRKTVESIHLKASEAYRLSFILLLRWVAQRFSSDLVMCSTRPARLRLCRLVAVKYVRELLPFISCANNWKHSLGASPVFILSVTSRLGGKSPCVSCWSRPTGAENLTLPGFTLMCEYSKE